MTLVGSNAPEGGVLLAEAEPTAEIVWGRKHIEKLPLDCIITLSQVRDGDNPEINKLIESIEKNDLINQIDVARMDSFALEEYIDFVNELWKSEHKIEDFMVGPDEKYYLCIAGNSRTVALREIAEKQPNISHCLDCKVHDAPTPYEIISLQLNENIYHEPSKARQAMAIAETYYYGLAKGMWGSSEEFARLNRDKFSKNALANARHFAKLPAPIREFVFIPGDPLPMNVALELGKIVEPLRIFYSRTVLGNISSYKRLENEHHKSLIDCSVNHWLGCEIARMRAKKTKPLATQQRIHNECVRFRRLNAAKAKGMTFDLKLDGPERELLAMDKQKQKEYEQLIWELSDQPLSSLNTVLKCHADLLNDGQQLLLDIGERIKARVANVGGEATRMANVEIDFAPSLV